MDGELYEVFKTLGELTGQLDALIKAVDKDREAALAQTNSMRELLQALAEANRVAISQREEWQREWLSEWQPLMESFRKHQQQSEGRKQIGQAIVALWVTISGLVIAVVTWVLSHWHDR